MQASADMLSTHQHDPVRVLFALRYYSTCLLSISSERLFSSFWLEIAESELCLAADWRLAR